MNFKLKLCALALGGCLAAAAQAADVTMSFRRRTTRRRTWSSSPLM